MELLLDNVGIIKDSTVKLDGLTVITGKNSSGKTTVGKVLYAIVRAVSNIDMEFEDSIKSYIRTCFRAISFRLFSRSQIFSRQIPKGCSDSFSFLLETLSGRNLYNFGLSEMLSLLDKMIYCISNISPDDLDLYRQEVARPNPTGKQSFEHFDDLKEELIQMCMDTQQVLSAPDAFDSFMKDRIRTLLLNEFHGQINPIRNPQLTSKISLSDRAEEILELCVKNKMDFDFVSDHLHNCPFSTIAFIDNPFIIDKIDSDMLSYRNFGHDTMLSERTLVKGYTGYAHDEHLIKLLSDNKKQNYFDSVSLQNKLKPIYEKINEIVPGEFERASDGTYYVLDGDKLNIQNLATGSKMFFLIKMLLVNGTIDKETALILDEPESHLHPEWINKFAEILVLLIKELKATILITTHSPNLLLALNVFAKKYGITDVSHFYLANSEKEKNTSVIECIDNNINEAYTHLSVPFIEMSIQRDIEEGK